MPPTLRSLKYRDSASSDAFVSEANALNSLPTAEIKDLKVKVEAQRPAKVTKKRKTHKRIKYQKAPFALRAKLVEMVNNEGYSIRQVTFFQIYFLIMFWSIHLKGGKEAFVEIFDSEVHPQALS